MRRMLDSLNNLRNEYNPSHKEKFEQYRKQFIDFNISKFISPRCKAVVEDQKSEIDTEIGYSVESGAENKCIADKTCAEHNINQFYEEHCCSICLGDFEEGDVLAKSKFQEISNCVHEFHYDCLQTWLSKHDECPICRQNMLVQDLPSQCDNDSRSIKPVIRSNSPHEQISNNILNTFRIRNYDSQDLPLYSISSNSGSSVDENDALGQSNVTNSVFFNNVRRQFRSNNLSTIESDRTLNIELDDSSHDDDHNYFEVVANSTEGDVRHELVHWSEENSA